jgi:hypothetical protein
MTIKESMRFSIICAVMFVQYVILIANINNFTSLHKKKEYIGEQIKIAESEQINSLESIKRELNSNFSRSGVDNKALVKTNFSEIEKLLTPEEIEANKQKENLQNNIIIQ